MGFDLRKVKALTLLAGSPFSKDSDERKQVKVYKTTNL
jgi:hypothetical protein